MPRPNQAVCWVVTDGKIGTENQCLGLAGALGLTPVVKRIRLRPPWRQLAPWLRLGLRWAAGPEGDPVEPPWPDILIASGRASVPVALHVRAASRAGGQKGTFVVQIQNPVIAPRHFDLVVAPEHDGLAGRNVTVLCGSVHRVTPELLRREGEALAPRLAALSSPRIAVLLGGHNAVYRMTPEVLRQLGQNVAAEARRLGGSVLATPSRRTPPEAFAAFREALGATPAFVWNGEGPNPYFGLLGLADAIIVTADSVNLASEACRTGKKVYVLDLPGKGASKFRQFHEALRRRGCAEPFTGRIEPGPAPVLDEVSRVAALARTAFERHRGASLPMPPEKA